VPTGFLTLNGLAIEIDDTEALALDIIAFIVGERTVEQFVAAYLPLVRPYPDP
jgi:hypothetical protein